MVDNDEQVVFSKHDWYKLRKARIGELQDAYWVGYLTGLIVTADVILIAFVVIIVWIRNHL